MSENYFMYTVLLSYCVCMWEGEFYEEISEKKLNKFIIYGHNEKMHF